MRTLRNLALALATATTMAGLTFTPATAQETQTATVSQLPADTQSDRAWWKIAQNDARVEAYSAYSPSMDRTVPLAVIPATDQAGQRLTGAPTLYLLNGAGGAEQNADWLSRAPELVNFYSGKGVNIVIPQAGAFTYYLDWYAEPNGSYGLQGPQLWETFLTKELPPVIEAELGANDRRGVAGFSMSATSALLFAEHNPGMYDAVGSFSGCAATSTPLPYLFHGLTLDRANATMEQMVGPQGGEHNLYNDALVNAEGLRGSEIYVSNGSGLAGASDLGSAKIRQGMGLNDAVAASSVLTIEGGAIEAASNGCTHDLRAKLNSLGIPADYKLRATGTHSWPYWRYDIVDSWPTFARGLGLA